MSGWLFIPMVLVVIAIGLWLMSLIIEVFRPSARHLPVARNWSHWRNLTV